MITFKKFMLISFLACISIVAFQGCTSDDNKADTYQDILRFTDGIKVINTHEHQHRPDEFGLDSIDFYHLVQKAYLMQDLVSAGGQGIYNEAFNATSLDKQWEVFGDRLDYSRATSYYGHFIKGFQKLYDFDDLYFTENNIPPLSARVTENYSNYNTWFSSAFQKAGFDLIFLDRYWNSLDWNIDTNHYALVFHINEIVLQSSNRPATGADLHSIYRKADEDGQAINTLNDYLTYCDHLFQMNVEHKAVTLKSSMAYSRTIYFEDVALEDATKLFAKPSANLSPDEARIIQDYLFHWFVQKAIEYDLPVQIHTGYLAGIGNYLENSDPLKLNSLFMQYPDAKFVLFHGGYPWTSEFIAMGKMFSNVYLDLVWLPQISREKAVLALDEMLDCVPYNKIFWGGDCHFIEEATGSLEFAKSVVAETLSNRIERGLLTEEVAMEIAERIFRENAIEVFKLEEILGREF